MINCNQDWMLLLKFDPVKFLLVFICLFLINANLCAQEQEYVYRNPKDSTFNCYLKLIPKGELKGLVIRDYSRLPDTARKSPYQYSNLALEAGFVVLYTVSSNYFPELFYDNKGPTLLDDIINEVLEEYPSLAENIFIGGISASGTRAMRYVMYCNQGKSKYGTKVKGVFAVDSPLDNERFYRSAHMHADNFKKGMKEEAEWMMKTYPERMGGSPDEKPDNYRNYSVYSYTEPDGGNVIHFKNQSILIYHEPDMDWWINERGAAFYDINSFDLTGFVTELNRLGNKDVMLVTTSGKGYKGKERNCHSWTIVDENQLVEWMVDRLN